MIETVEHVGMLEEGNWEVQRAASGVQEGKGTRRRVRD